MKNLKLSASMMDKLNQIMQQLLSTYPKVELESAYATAYSMTRIKHAGGVLALAKVLVAAIAMECVWWEDEKSPPKKWK